MENRNLEEKSERKASAVGVSAKGAEDRVKPQAQGAAGSDRGRGEGRKRKARERGGACVLFRPGARCQATVDGASRTRVLPGGSRQAVGMGVSWAAYLLKKEGRLL